MKGVDSNSLMVMCLNSIVIDLYECANFLILGQNFSQPCVSEFDQCKNT